MNRKMINQSLIHLFIHSFIHIRQDQSDAITVKTASCTATSERHKITNRNCMMSQHWKYVSANVNAMLAINHNVQ